MTRVAYAAAYRAAHREERRAYGVTYYAAHREEMIAYGVTYYAAHREERRAYLAAHREERRAYLAALVSVGGVTINGNTMPPEMREVAVLLKRLRQANTTTHAGGTR